MKLKIFICFMFISTLSYSQNKSNLQKLDSLVINNKYDNLFNYSSKPIPILSLQNKLYPLSFEFETSFLNNSSTNLYELNSFNMDRIKSEMNQSFNIYRKGQNKNDLGVFGDILGYASSAAAIGLAAYHVVKFKKKYGFK